MNDMNAEEATQSPEERVVGKIVLRAHNKRYAIECRATSSWFELFVLDAEIADEPAVVCKGAFPEVEIWSGQNRLDIALDERNAIADMIIEALS